MNPKKLRVLKNDVLYFHIIKYWDKTNGNTYAAFNKGYIVRKGKRIYLTDLNCKNWITNNSKYCGGIDSYNIVKYWLNDNSNLKIGYMSDFHNIIVSDEYLSSKDYNRITN